MSGHDRPISCQPYMMVPAPGVMGGTHGGAVRRIIPVIVGAVNPQCDDGRPRFVQLHARYITIYTKLASKRGNPSNLPFFLSSSSMPVTLADDFPVYHYTGKMVSNSLLCITGETQDLFVSHFCMILIHNSPCDFGKNYQLLVSVIAINREKR